MNRFGVSPWEALAILILGFVLYIWGIRAYFEFVAWLGQRL